ATLVLPYKLGPALSAEMLFSAENYSGGSLKERGVAIPVVRRNEVIPTALRLARQFAEKPVTSLKLLKRQLTARLVADLPQTIKEECEMHRLSFAQPEVRERIESLFGK